MLSPTLKSEKYKDLYPSYFSSTLNWNFKPGELSMEKRWSVQIGKEGLEPSLHMTHV
jgi:hypothetical protein